MKKRLKNFIMMIATLACIQSVAYALQGSANRKIQSKVYSTETVENENALPGIRKFEEGLLLGAGARMQKFSLEVRYGLTNGMSTETDVNVFRHTNHFLAGYRF